VKTKIPAILSREEIIQRYPNEWVLIAYTKLDKELNVIRGEVLAHSQDYDLLYDNSLPRKGKSVAIEYTGTNSSDIAGFL